MKEITRGVPAAWAAQVRRSAQAPLAVAILALAGCGGSVNSNSSSATPTQADQQLTDPIA